MPRAESETPVATDRSSTVDDATAVELWGRVIRGFTATNRRVHAVFKERFDLNEAEVETLLSLVRRPDHQARHNTLATAAGFSTGGFTKVADKLTARGLTERNACSADRRVSYLQLTAQGAELAAELEVAAAEVNREYVIEVLGFERASLVADAFAELYQAHHNAAKP